MTMFPSSLSSQILRSACALAMAIGVSSCKSPNSGGNSAYASSDGGGFNPYPGVGSTSQNGSLLAPGAQPQYAEAPPPPPPGFDGPSDHFQAPPTKRSSSSSSGSSSSKSKSKTKTKPKSSTVSSSGTKKKGGYTYSGGSVHTVTKGDTLYAIAANNKTTVAKLKALNRLKSNIVSPGQKIKVK